ncbi:hypothetical protein QR680_001245 [Steinernema hermaphroditum]|uniref:SAM domain-containing protein n=1 Tax=Steinernema hermaphroditum TaxID=289476 RepID=A0AA39LFH9_9BILA|nr:hypothetical protein QR680_001245 [Steinernema hermaphroditum]
MPRSSGSSVPQSLNTSDDAPPPLLSAIQPDPSPTESSPSQSSDSPPQLIKAPTPEYMPSPLDLTSVQTSVITTQTRTGNPLHGIGGATSTNRSHFEPPRSHATLPVISASTILPTFVTTQTPRPSCSKPIVAPQQRRNSHSGPSIRPKTPTTQRLHMDNNAKADYQQAMAAAAAAGGMVPFFLQPGGTMQMNFPQVAFAQQAMAQQVAATTAFTQLPDPNMPGPSILSQNLFLTAALQQQQHQQRQQSQQQLQQHLQQQQSQQQFQIQFTHIPQQPLSLVQSQNQHQFLVHPQMQQPLFQAQTYQTPRTVQAKRPRPPKQPEKQQKDRHLGSLIGIAQPPRFGHPSAEKSTNSTFANPGVRLSTGFNPVKQPTPQLLRPQAQRPTHAVHSNPALAAALSATRPSLPIQTSRASISASPQQFINVSMPQGTVSMEQIGYFQQEPSVVVKGNSQPAQQQRQQPVINRPHPPQIRSLPPQRVEEENIDDRPPILERNVTQPLDLSPAPAPVVIKQRNPERPPPLNTNKSMRLTDEFAQQAAANRYRREVEIAKEGEPIITRHYIGGLVIEESSEPFKFSDAEDDSGSSDDSDFDIPEISDIRVMRRIQDLDINVRPMDSPDPHSSKKRVTVKSPSPQPGPSGIKIGKIKHKTVKKKKPVLSVMDDEEKSRTKAKLVRQKLGSLEGVHNSEALPGTAPLTVRIDGDQSLESTVPSARQDATMSPHRENEEIMSPALLVDTTADDVPREQFCLRCALPLSSKAYSRCPMFCSKACKKLFKKFQKRSLSGKDEDDFEGFFDSFKPVAQGKKLRKITLKTPNARSSTEKSSVNTPTTPNRIVVVFKKSPTDDSISASLPNSPTTKVVQAMRNEESMGWSVERVAEWVNAATGHPSCADYVKEHEIDGSALAVLAFGEVRTIPFKLGPKVKLQEALSELKEQLKTVEIARYNMKEHPELIRKPVTEWTYEEVMVLIHKLTGSESIAYAFQQEEVDGCALVLLEERSMLQDLNVMKQGHQLKIMSAIKELKALSGA